MRLVYKIMSLFESELGSDLYRRLLEIYPDESDHGTFEMTLAQDDARAQEVLLALERHGWELRDHMDRGRWPSYSLDVYREYDEEDFERAEYLTLAPETIIGTLTTDDEGIILAPDRREDGLLSEDVLKAEIGRCVVSDRLRRGMEEAGLEGLTFRDVALDPAVLRRHRRKQPPVFWELTSGRTMPPLSPYNSLLNGDGTVWQGHPVYGPVVREKLEFPEALIAPAQLHYRRADLGGLAPFDLFLTHERFGGLAQRLIGSARLYRFCRDRGLRILWSPVLIEEE